MLFLIIIIISLLCDPALLLLNQTNNLIDTVINLSNYNLNNINNILIYKNKYIIIGGENFLLKLSAKNLQVNEQIRYGPVYDSRQCKFYPNEECNSFNTEKYLTNNYNKLIIPFENGNNEDISIITCWTAYQGICDMRSISNLNNLIVNSTIPSVANDVFNSTIGFVTLSPSLQPILLVATTYNNNGPYRDDIPAIAGRSLQPTSSSERYRQLQFMQILTNNNQGLKESKSSIEFMSRQLKTFIVKYIDGFKTKFYNYFLTLQHLDVTTSNLGAQLVQTKIIRFCQNDLSFIKSYMEQPLRCESKIDGTFYNELVHSRLVEWNFGDKKKISYLVGLFQETKRYTMQNASDIFLNKQPVKQAVCVYKLNDVNRKFLQNFKSCLTSTSSSQRGLSYIKTDQICTSSIFSATTNDQDDLNENEIDNEINDNYCSIIDSTNMNLYPIGGQLPVTTDLVFELNDTNILYNHLNFKFLSSNKQAMLVLLSNTNNLLKFYKLSLNKASLFKVLAETSLSSQSTLSTRPLIIDRPLTNLEFNMDKTKLFVVNKNFLYQIAVNDEILFGGDKQSANLVVNSIEPVLVTSFEKQKWIEIQLLGEIKSKFKCQYYNDKVVVLIDAIAIDFNRLKCSLPHQTQIEQLKIVDFDTNHTLLYRNEIASGKFELYLSLIEVNETSQSVVFNQTIRVINCNAHKSCLSCSYSQELCKWSLNRCWNRNDSIETVSVDTVDACSSYNVGTSKLLIPFTTSSRQQAPLTLELLNVNSNYNMVCMITFIRSLNLYQNLTIKLKILNETHVQCVLDEFFQLNELFMGANGKLETNLRVYDTNLDYYIDSKVFNIEFIFYKCEILANNCAQCAQIKPFYSCGWCLNSFSKQECKFIPVNVNRIPILRKLFIDTQKCKLFNETTSTEMCSIEINNDSNDVLSVKPNRIPLGGGSLMTISGVQNAETVVNVTICNIKCEIKENFSKQIKCVTQSSTSEQECLVTLYYSDFKIEVLTIKVDYVDVKIESVKPNELIQSCKGCVVEVYGKNLDVGVNRRIRILDSSLLRSQVEFEVAQVQQQIDYNEEITCNIESVTKDKLKCSLSSNFNYLGKKNLVYEIDKQMSILNYQSIRISSNPLIISINKKETILQGGTRFELQGYNFNLIQKIQVFIEYRQEFYVQQVYKRLSNERLVFKFPSLSQFINENEQITANIGFLMDNYNQTLDQIQISYFKIDKTRIFDINSVNLLDNGLNEHVLLLKFNSNNDLQVKFKPDLDIFILNDNLNYCYCDFKLWLNDTYLTCKFNKLNCDLVDNQQTITNKKIINFGDLIKLFIGNYEIQQEKQINYENNDTFNNYLKSIQLKQQQQLPANQLNLNRVILIITSILLAILFIILLIIVVYYYKKKFFKLKEKNKLKLIKLSDNDDENNEKLHKLLNKISYLETNLNHKCKNEYEKIKIEFLNEFNLNLIYNGIPIHSYKQYLLNCLNLNSIGFGNTAGSSNESISGYAATGGSVFYATIKSTTTEMTTQPLTYTQNKNYTKSQFDAMLLFNQLLNNKIFLNIFINVLNKQDTFVNKEREQFTSLLQLLLKTNLPYLYSIIKLQLGDLITNIAGSKPQAPTISTISTTITTLETTKTTPTPIIDYLLTNWVSIFMYQYINDNLSIKFYRLIKLIKYQLESGPIDSCQNLAKYCLNENYLLKFDDSSYKKLYINLINQQQVYKTYFILDCDTIRQVKEKFLDFLYKNIANSQRPNVNDIELELYILKNQQQLNEILFDSQNIAKALLRESNDNEFCLEYNGCKYRRLLCVKDFGIADGAYISIQYKQPQQQQHQILTLNSSSNKFVISNYPTLVDYSNKFLKNYHLVKPNESISSSSSSTSSTSPLAGKKNKFKLKNSTIDDDDNVKLTRLLLIKGTLQPFIDDLFETLFTNTANLSPIIKHLFDFFDGEFNKIHNRNDENLMKLWKTNIYFLKFWLNILKNPQLVFDMNKTTLIDASIQSIIQVFIDSCSSNESLFNKVCFCFLDVCPNYCSNDYFSRI
jgi:hypothetical protein